MIRRVRDGRFAVDLDAERCLALLSVVGRRAVDPKVLLPLQAAAKHWQSGDKALANLRLVFAGLPALHEPADAYRLQAAAYCLDHGLAPRELMKSLHLDPVVLDPAPAVPEPRVPPGHGRESGEWTVEGSQSGSTGQNSANEVRNVTAETHAHVELAATTGNFGHACKALGLNPNDASRALHAAKRAAGLGGADNCTFDLDTGDIFFNGEHIGNLGD